MCELNDMFVYDVLFVYCFWVRVSMAPTKIRDVTRTSNMVCFFSCSIFVLDSKLLDPQFCWMIGKVEKPHSTSKMSSCVS